ncbi:Uncharacterised protein [Candidatus Anstonella stagnisolia]|nr:Uncharacterised protein [Candidatus Anstonella stagnisolia]
MKAQLSLELLLITALALAMLSISLLSLSSLVQNADKKIAQTSAQTALSKLSFAADDVCLMGEGNVRIVETALDKFRLKYEEGNLSLFYKNSIASKGTHCEIEVNEGEIFEKTARVSYENAKAKIGEPA